MTLADLRLHLATEFDLVCFVDLADLRCNHSLAFNFFQKYHQPEFSPDQRLVLYSANRPEPEFLHHIQRAAAVIDISNWFILLVTSADISNELAQANTLYGNDGVVITNMVMPLRDTKKFDNLEIVSFDTVCAYPFMKMDIRENQSVSPCCKTADLENLQTVAIDQIFYSSGFDHIRNGMKRGEMPSACSICWQNEKQSITSLRQLSLVQFQKILDFECLDRPKIKQLDLSPTSLCNFKCRICNPRSSTQIATEELKHATSNDVKNKMRELLVDARERPVRLMKQLRMADWTSVEYLHLFGGEPLIWPDLEEFVVYLVDIKQAFKINLIINTNCSTFPQNIENLVKNFKSVEFLLSVDDLGERFELQRGGSWVEVHRNILSYAALKNTNIQVKLSPTVNIQNLLYLDQLIEFANKIGIEIVWCYLENPAVFNIDRITQRTKELVYAKYNNHPEPELQKIAVKVMQTDPVGGHEFLNHMKMLDIRRGQDFQSSHKEIYDAMSQ